MGLFKEVFCSECGKKAGLLTRTKLIDGKYLCSDCTADIPSYIMECVSEYYDYEDFKALKGYIKYSNETLKPKFNETASYEKLHIDEDNKLFYISTGFFGEPLYLEFANVSSFDMDYQAETVKEGLIGDKVFGSVIVDLRMAVPKFAYIKVLAKDVKAKAKTNFLGTKVTYECPKKMEEFVIRFMTAWNEALEDIQQEYAQESVNMNELEKAKVLFMLDDIDDISLEDIKEQRNRLIRMFHPDAGNDSDTKYAQKINNAYEILKNAIGK